MPWESGSSVNIVQTECNRSFKSTRFYTVRATTSPRETIVHCERLTVHVVSSSNPGLIG